MQMEYTEESEYILQGPEGSELLKLYGTNKGLKWIRNNEQINEKSFPV